MRAAVTFALVAGSAWAQPAADASFARAVQLQQAGDWKAAERAYRAHLKQFGAKPEVLANLGAVLVKEERFPEAIQAYREALRLAPGLTPVHLNLGLAYFKSGQLAPAVEEFTALLAKQPGNAQARQLRGVCLLELERNEEAAADYSALMPSQDANVRIGLASAYLRLKRLKESQEIIDTLIESESAPVKLLLGQMQMENGQLDEAAALLKRALELDPAIQTAHLSLGAIYWQRGERAAAVEEWRQEVTRHPQSFQANYSLGAGLALTPGGAGEAERYLRKAVTIKPGSALALYQLAKLLWQGKNPEAVPLLFRAVAADPNYRNSHYLLGTIYQSLGRKAEAAREFAEVKRISEAEIRRSVDLFEAAPPGPR
jgi:tetratricopeptide (TPR) repeat protein